MSDARWDFILHGGRWHVIGSDVETPRCGASVDGVRREEPLWPGSICGACLGMEGNIGIGEFEQRARQLFLELNRPRRPWAADVEAERDRDREIFCLQIEQLMGMLGPRSSPLSPAEGNVALQWYDLGCSYEFIADVVLEATRPSGEGTFPRTTPGGTKISSLLYFAAPVRERLKALQRPSEVEA